MPVTHPNIDLLIQFPERYNKTPAWHPDIETTFMWIRSEYRPGTYLGLVLAALFALAVAARAFRWAQRACSDEYVTAEDKNAVVELEMATKDSVDHVGHDSAEAMANGAVVNIDASAPTEDEKSGPRQRRGHLKQLEATEEAQEYELPPPRDIHRQLSNRLNAEHKQELYDYQPQYSRSMHVRDGPLERFFTKGKDVTRLQRMWMVLRTRRCPCSHYTWLEALLMFCYVVLNLACIAVVSQPGGGGPDWARGFGSLAAANSMVLIVPATRNSVLTWFLKVPFDHIILYHRAIGRIALACVALHLVLFLDKLPDEASTPVYYNGLIAAGFGFVILVTTFDFVRRRFFNLFFFSHYSFIFYFYFAYIHFRETHVFILIGVGLYALDRVLRMLWGLCPRRTLVFRAKGEDLAQVRFAKNPLTAMLGMHSVGFLHVCVCWMFSDSRVSGRPILLHQFPVDFSYGVASVQRVVGPS